MKPKSKPLNTTLATVVIVALSLFAMTYMDNDRTRNLVAGIVLLICVFAFTIGILLRESADKA